MQVHFKASDLFIVVGEGSTQKEAFKSVAEGYEPFAVNACGMADCKAKNIFPRVRVQGKFTYYEMVCKSCWAKLSYGQATEGGALYPRKKFHENHPKVKAGEVEADTFMPDNGWERWKRGEEPQYEEDEVEVVKQKPVKAKR